jgi:hypothetical protein
MSDVDFPLAATVTGRPPCTHCGATMWLSSIEPTDDPDWELRTFECPRCQEVEKFEVKIQRR